MAAQDLTSKKQAFMARAVAAAAALQAAREQLKALADEWTNNGYSGGIVQADIQSGSLLHLTPTLLANLMNSQAALETGTWNGVASNWTNVNAMISN